MLIRLTSTDQTWFHLSVKRLTSALPPFPNRRRVVNLSGSQHSGFSVDLSKADGRSELVQRPLEFLCFPPFL
jgi:hypothetical protein